MNLMRTGTLLVAGTLLLTACAGSPAVATALPVPTRTPTALPATVATPAAGPALPTVTPPSPSPPTIEEVPVMTPVPTGSQADIPPALLDQIIADLAGRLGVSPEEVRVASVEAVNWRDSSLGCPEKGQMYLQVITPGYRVILEAQGRQYDYRASAQPATFRLCEGSD